MLEIVDGVTITRDETREIVFVEFFSRGLCRRRREESRFLNRGVLDSDEMRSRVSDRCVRNCIIDTKLQLFLLLRLVHLKILPQID